MIEIAICDDFTKDAEQLHNLLTDSETKPFSVKCFQDAQKLYDAVEQWSYRPSIVFMDIELGAVNGIDYAEKLYFLCPEIRFVFVTGYKTKYAQSIFLKSITPDGYLSKPVEKELLDILLKKVLQAVRTDREKSLLVKTKSSLRYIPYYLIIYLESSGHYINIRTAAETVTCVDKLDIIEKQLPECFLRAHKSYILNMDYANSIDNNEFIVPNARIPISRSRIAEVRRKYFCYKGGFLQNG